MERYRTLVEQCDAAIRAGRVREVRKHLAKVNCARIPRDWRMPLAKICRRAGLYSTGLSLLTRLIHSENKSISPTAGEYAEYAALLLRSGAVKEAEEYLLQINKTEAPESLLYLAYCSFTRWEFAQAIPFLDAYLEAPLATYAKLVGQLNLVYALVENGQHERALSLSEELMKLTAREGYKLAESNFRAYRAQAFFQADSIALARREIEFARKLGEGDSVTNDQLIVHKWKLILDAAERNSLLPLDELRNLAIEKRDWAAYREADYYSLKIEFSKERFLNLYFGTPFRAFRERLNRETGHEIDRRIYVLGKKSAPRFDLRTGNVGDQPRLKPGRKIHHLLEVLLRDFYEPLTVAGLFSGLFPNEHFIIGSSPDRVYQTLYRARRWIRSMRIPINISESGGFFHLKITGDFSFRISLDRPTVDPMAWNFDRLRQAFPDGGLISAKDVSLRLQMSRTTVSRLMNWAIERGKVERFGRTDTSAMYRIVEPASSLKSPA